MRSNLCLIKVVAPLPKAPAMKASVVGDGRWFLGEDRRGR
jgi:hypothetical protein